MSVTESESQHSSPTQEVNSPSLKKSAVRGALWAIGGHGAAQVLRLGSNLILTRLLFPEAFGMMALVTVFMQGLQMFSDVGVGPAIIQNKRGNDPGFLNTAWTIQIVRGIALSLCACFLAFPVATFYAEPMLLWVLPVAGLTAFISGFNSTALFTLNRSLALGRITFLDLASQLAGMVCMVVWAYISPSVWALVAGGLISTAFKAALSHSLSSSTSPNRIHWDSAAAGALFRFGRWIFLSTILTFLASQLDRLILGKVLDPARLGIYTIALFMALALPSAARQVFSKVLFPLFSELVRQDAPDLYERLRRSRVTFTVPVVLLLLTLSFFAEGIIHLLYDDRYADAGWMLKVLALGSVAGIVCATYGSVLLALGGTFEIMCLLAAQIAILLAAAFVGFQLRGEAGFIIGIASVEWVNYGLVAFVLRRRRLWQPEIDIPVLALAALFATGFVL